MHLLLLEDAGYTVTEAADGIAVLEVLRSSTSAYVTLLDLDLTRADGLTVPTAVAESSLATRHPFILLTAVAHKRVQETDEICARLRVPVLLKPFDVDNLLRADADAALSISPPVSA